MGGSILLSSLLGKWRQESTTKGNNYDITSECSSDGESTNTSILLSTKCRNLFVKNPNYGKVQNLCEGAFIEWVVAKSWFGWEIHTKHFLQ